MGATVTDPLVGRLVDGRYEILSRIARGGMATVYLAIDRRLDREVALKVMLPHLADGGQGSEFVARFRREARSAARLTHPGLVAVYDQGVDQDTSYLTMEYIDGSNLRALLEVEGALSLEEAFGTVEAILDALAAAHRNNLVHRDVKPENVLLALDGRIKLADFGLARAVTEVTSTTTGTILGTVAYLGPELILTGTGDARTDVYAIGVMLFEMLVGCQPFTGLSPIQVAYQHVHEDIPAPSSIVDWIPIEVDELVCALAARAPENRPANASMALDLVRRTRSALSDADLARRAVVDRPEPVAIDGALDDHPMEIDGKDDIEPDEANGSPSEGSPPDGPDQDISSTDDGPDDPAGRNRSTTQALGIGSSGSTIALPLGLAGAEPPDDDIDGKTVRRRRRRRRIRNVLLILILVAAAVTGYAFWWFNVGPGAYTNVPSGLVGSTATDAEAALDHFGLRVNSSQSYDDTVPEGEVIETDPAEEARIPKDGVVALLVSQGIEMYKVPEALVGKKESKATLALTEEGFKVGSPTQVYDDEVEAGVVMKVSEKPGSEVPHDTEITLTVSQGRQPVTIPQVVNSTQEDATRDLEALGLKVEVSKKFSDDVDKGFVISQSLAPKETAHRLDTATITVSKGRELVEVPDVRGISTEAAGKKLTDQGLVPDNQFAFGGFLGQVRFQNLEAGELVPKGTSVILTIF